MRWSFVSFVALAACEPGVFMTVENQSSRTLSEVQYWDHGDECENHLDRPLEPGDEVRIALGPWDEPQNVYRLYGARDADGQCWSLYAGMVQDEAFTFEVTDEDFETWPCACD